MGSKTPEVKETAAEKQQFQTAQHRWNERKDDGYLAAENDNIKAANNDYSQLFAGKASADVAAAEKAAYATVGTPTASRLGEISNTIGRATATGKNDAYAKALDVKDNNTLAVIKRGNDVAADSSAILGQAAGLASKRAVDDVKNQILVNNARTEGALKMVDGYMQGSTMKSAGYKLGKGADGKYGLQAPDKVTQNAFIDNNGVSHAEVKEKGVRQGLGSFVLSSFGR